MAKQNILFLCHIEDSFRHLFPDPLYIPRLIKACQSAKYNKVIALVSNIMDYDPIPEIADIITDRIDFSWGYEPEQFENEPEEEKFILDASYKSLHDWTWIPPELRDKSWATNSNIFVGGGCDGECLADFEVVLEHLEVDYKRVEGYIYST